MFRPPLVQCSARSGLHSLAPRIGAGAGAARAQDDELEAATAGLEEFLKAPPAARAGLGDFLTGEGIEDVQALHEALRASGVDGTPQILERARTRLVAGSFTFLRSACEHAGGLSQAFAQQSQQHRFAAAPAPAAHPAPDDLPDYKRLRGLLDSAQFGEPLPRALPSKSLLDMCDTAATDKGPSPATELDTVTGDRPFASAVRDRIRQGWAELLTGRATPADILNVLFAMSEAALDKRQSQAVAERAGVRLAASLRHSGYLNSLARESEPQALQVYGAILQTEHPHLVTQFLDEEATKERQGFRAGQRRGAHAMSSDAGARVATQQDGDKHCLLWGLGLCDLGEKCCFQHLCPYKGAVCGSAGGCLLERGRGHLQTLQRREVKEKIVPSTSRTFQAPPRAFQGPPRRRSRSFSRRKRSRSQSPPIAKERKDKK